MYLMGTKKEMAMLRTLRVPEFRRLPMRVLWGMRKLLRHEKLVRLNGKTVVNSFLPPFPSPAFRRLGEGIQGLRRGRVAPVSAYVAVTDRCRYRCWHCSKAHRSGREMRTEVLRKAIADVQELGVSVVGFTGGEPLLRGDLEDLVGMVDERSVSILFTTGDGLTEERAAALKRKGLFGAAVSLDHYEAEEHDRRRGTPGAFRSALEAIRLFRAQGLYTMIQLVATKELTRPEVLDRYLALARELGIHEIRVLEPMPTGHLVGREDTVLTAEERERLRALHLRAAGDPDMPKVNAFAHIESCGQYGCGAGFQHLYIDAEGNVCPCDFTPISFGNVNQEDLGAIWRKMNRAFRRPGCRCFLMENRDVLRDAFRGQLPVRFEDVARRCRFPANGELPAYYRVLGWREGNATAENVATVRAAEGAR